MKDSKHKKDQEVRDETLKDEVPTNVKSYPLSMILEEEDDREAMEEAHYVHTMNAFVELIVVYGYDKVIGDLRIAMTQKEW